MVYKTGSASRGTISDCHVRYKDYATAVMVEEATLNPQHDNTEGNKSTLFFCLKLGFRCLSVQSTLSCCPSEFLWRRRTNKRLLGGIITFPCYISTVREMFACFWTVSTCTFVTEMQTLVFQLSSQINGLKPLLILSPARLPFINLQLLV